MRRLYRSRKYCILGGVLGGIAEYFDTDPTIIRLIAIILLFLTVPLIPIAYIVMWIIVPFDETSVPTDHFERVERIKEEVVTSVKDGFDRIASKMHEKFAERQAPQETTQPSAPSQPPQPQQATAAHPEGAHHPESHAMMFGVLIVAVGAFLLLSNMLHWFTPKLWGPAILILIGFYFIFARNNR